MSEMSQECERMAEYLSLGRELTISLEEWLNILPQTETSRMNHYWGIVALTGMKSKPHVMENMNFWTQEKKEWSEPVIYLRL